MSTAATATAFPSETRLIAPIWHLFCVFALLAVWVGLSLGHHFSLFGLSQRFTGYLLVLVFEWFLFAFILFGLRVQGVPFASLFGEMSPSLVKILRDIGIAVAYLVIANIVLGLVTAVLGFLFHAHPANTEAQKELIPHTGPEIAVYLLVALTAGICEETIFRGYLQRQFTALTKSAVAGALIQGLIFGVAHSYQGWVMVVAIAVFGCMFGALTLWRGSLRPGIIAHFLQDGVWSTIARHFFR